MAESNDSIPVARAVRRGRVALKTSVIWGVLYVMVLDLCWMQGCTMSIVFALEVAAIFIGVLATIVVLSSLLTRRGTRRALAEINDANAALWRGQLDVANQVFTRLCGSTNSVLSALARHNLGWTLMRQARLKEAYAIASDNDATHERQLHRLLIHATSSVDLSIYSALLGNLDEAQSWLERTERRAATAGNPSLPAMQVFAKAVLDCRRDRCEDAARLLEERWAECEAALTGSDLRPLRVVRAFAVAAAGPRSAGVADSLLATSRPVFDGEYDFLGVVWPAMETFLETHRLARAGGKAATSTEVEATTATP